MDNAINKLTGLVNKAKNNSFVQNVTGAAQRNAMQGLNNANSAMNNFANTNSTFKTLQNNISTINNKIKNVDGHLPGNITNKVNKAKNNVDYLTTKNKTLLEKGQQQSFIKNMFDKGVKNAQQEVAQAQKKLSNLTNEQAKLRNNVLENLNIDLDKNIADMNQFKKSNKEFQNLTKDISHAQAAYDKAVRNTKRARTAVIGTAGVGAGAGMYGINRAKQNNDKNKQLQYIY